MRVILKIILILENNYHSSMRMFLKDYLVHRKKIDFNVRKEI